MYLGATLCQVETETGTKCWSMSSENYVKAAIENLESKLGKSDMHLPKCRTPMSTSYHPSEDVTKELNVEGLQFYQEMIGILRWAVQICRVDILLEVSLLSSHSNSWKRSSLISGDTGSKYSFLFGTCFKYPNM